MKKITFLIFLVLLSWNMNSQITTYPYFEDFESGDGGWTVDDPASVSWELGTPANTIINSADTGTNAWVTSLAGEYGTGEDGSVVSPVFDLSSLSAPSIEVSIWINSEFSWDGLVLQSSIDSGGSWQNVGDLGDPNNWYNDDTIGANPGGSAIGWTGRDATGTGGWVVARHALIGLAGESNVLLRFAFGSDGSVQDEGVGFDSINVFEVSCPEPSGVTIDNITATSADVSWTAGGAETAWEVVVQTAGTGAPTGSGAPTGNPYAATGLTAVTDYEVYVRSDCGGTFSSWVGPIAFQSACSVFTPDYLETFTTIIPDCWDEADGGDPATGPTGLGAGAWGDDGYLNNGFTGAYKINLWQGGVNSDWILSPQFDLTGGPFQVDFDFGIMQFASATNAGTLGSDDTVQLLITTDNGATWINLVTFDNTSVVPVTGTQVVSDLTAYSGQTVQFAIYGSDGTVDDTEDNDIFVDNFRVRAIPTCPEPIGLTLDTFTDISADISWTPGGGETAWEVVVQPAGTGVPTGPGTPTTNNPYTETGLTATTDYEVWIRGDCGAQGLSSWIGPLNFTTFNTPPPPPVGVTCSSGSSSFVFTGEFDGIDGWTGNISDGDDGTWVIPNDSGSGGTGADAAFSGASFMHYEASGGTTATASAVTPAIDLTTAVDGAELSFYMHAFGADMGTLNVGVSTSQTGPFTTEFAWAGDLQTSGSDPWVPIGINLDAYLGQVIYIEFSHTGTGDFEGDMSIDYVRVETCGSFCIAPSSIVISNATQTTADIDWTANSGEMAWEYVVFPLGTGEPTGPGTPVTSTSVTETGLTGTTEYEVWVRADCGGGTFSLWSGPIPFFTAPENNDPCNAETAVVNNDDSCTLLTPGTLLQATPSGIPSGSCAGDPDDDVWFEFVATSENHVITIDNIAGGTFNIDHALYEGTCATPVELYCSDAEASVTPALIIGNTYYVRIFSAGSDLVDYTFDLCIRPGSGNVLVDQTTYTPEQLIVDVLIDSPCAQISNITYSTGTDFGEDNGIGYFSNPDGGFPFNDGLLLTTGDASESAGPNANFVSSGSTAWPGDADLTAIAGDDTNNATIIEFDFVPLNDELSFDFLMASEEYDMGGFECQFSDAFAFLLTDSNGITTNLAVVPGTTDPILVTNIHPDNGSCPAVNEQYFGEYIPDNLPPISFDGRTAVFTAFSPVNIGESYHIKLVIADARDSAWDSGVYLKAGSFDIGEVDLGGDITIAGGNAVCEDEPIVLDTSAPNVNHVWYKDGFVIGGETASTLNVTEAGLYTVQIIFSPSCIIDDEVLIEFLPNPIIANTPDNLSTCSTTNQAQFNLIDNDSVVLGAQNASDFTITYHESQTNADSGSNSLMSPYTNTSNPQTVFVRIEDNVTGCHETTSFTLSISAPTHTADSVELIGCDNDDDGIATFMLSDHDADVLNGQDASQFNVTYHNSQADADNSVGALTSSYDSSGEIVFVRVETVGLSDCFVTNSFELVIGTEPLTSFTSNFEYEVCPNATVPIVITATPDNYTVGEVTINWYLDNGLIPNENGLTLPVLVAGDYTIEVVFNDTGCSNDETITIIELETCVIPQGISPNNDGSNDTFDLSSYDVSKLEIYNRNGTLVYSKKNYTDEWHGQTDDGDELPVGTYFYTMEYQNGKTRAAWIYIQRDN